MTAFFLEAGFLGIMLFGLKRVGERLHFFATCMVALGTADLGVLDPRPPTAGCTRRPATTLVDGHFVPADWWQIIFNPSFPYRFVHWCSPPI